MDIMYVAVIQTYCYVGIHIYIYIEREREMDTVICTCIYVYTKLQPCVVAVLVEGVCVAAM